MSDNKENVDLNNYSDLDDVNVRRKVRADYRVLHNDIEENGEEIVNPDSTKLHEFLEKGEDLFTKVRHPREAVQDSSFLLALSKKGREQAQQLKTDVIAFNNHTFAEKLVSYVHGRRLDQDIKRDDVNLNEAAWKRLGNRACTAFKKVPRISFLLGPLVLEVEVKERNARADNRKKILEGETVKLKQIATVEQQEEATTKEVERIYKIIIKITNNGKKPTCFFRFIINPSSFGQTVENLFHLSFLIKDGRVAVDLDENELPALNLHETYREEHGDIIRKQVVVPLTIEDWKNLIEAYGITKPIIPTRDKIFTS